MAEKLSFPSVRITGIHAEFPLDGGLETWLKMTAPLCADLAEMLGAAYLLDAEIPRRELRVTFDFAMKAVRGMITPHPDLNSRRLSFESREISDFRVVRRKSKQSRKVSTDVEFRLESSTPIATLLDYVVNIGGPVGTLELTPMQGDLFAVSEVMPMQQPPPMPAKGSGRVH